MAGQSDSAAASCGAVQVFRLTASGIFTETAWIGQNTAEVDGAAEVGDLFGTRLAAADTSPNATSTATTTRVHGQQGAAQESGRFGRRFQTPLQEVGAAGDPSARPARHGASSLLADTGAKPHEAQAPWGHSHFDMTMSVHTHAALRAQREALDRVGSLLRADETDV